MEQLITKTLEALNIMSESEQKVAEFYRLCSEKFEEHCSFWEALAREEAGHAEVIKKLIALVSIHPSEFIPGKSLPVEAIKSFIMRTQANIDTVKRGDLPESKALLMAYHIENTFIEVQYADVVRTENEDYKLLLGQVISDTLKHKTRVMARMTKQKEAAKPSKKPS